MLVGSNVLSLPLLIPAPDGMFQLIGTPEVGVWIAGVQSSNRLYWLGSDMKEAC